MASNVLLSLIFTILCLVYVQSDSIEDAKYKGFVEIIPLQRSKMEPIAIIRDKPGKLLMEIYCYEGVNSIMVERFKRVFSTGKLHINTTATDYQLFSGTNESAVYAAYKEVHQTWLTWRNLFPWQADRVPVAPFNKTCIGVVTAHPYTVVFIRNLIDPWLLLIFFSGIMLFFLAEKLSKNVFFYYGAGVSVGLFASLLIMVFVISRFVPWRKGAYAVFLSGWAVVSWAFVQMWGNLADMAHLHYQYLLIYFVVVGLISFAICYYKGPVCDPRSLNLIKWTVQLVALGAVFLSMQVEEASLAVIFVMLSVYNFPKRILLFCHQAFRRQFPRKRHLLTLEEYVQEADENTKQALDKLREYCRSPDCDVWKTISRLETPQRFAKWIEGSPHISDDELDFYESQPPFLHEVTDDEDEIDFQFYSL